MKNPKIYYYLIENYECCYFGFERRPNRLRLVRTHRVGVGDPFVLDVNIEQKIEIDFQVIKNYFDDDFELLEINL